MLQFFRWIVVASKYCCGSLYLPLGRTELLVSSCSRHTQPISLSDRARTIRI